MVPNKPYLRLVSSDAITYSLLIEVQPSGNSFDFNHPVANPDEANSRLTLTFKRGAAGLPLSSTYNLRKGDTIQGSNPAKSWNPTTYQKITVVLTDENNVTLGLATALSSKAIVDTHAPTVWLKFNYTGNYNLYLNGASLPSNAPATVIGNIATVNYTNGASDNVNLQLDSTISIITVHDTNSGLAEQGSTSTGDADASGGGEVDF